MKRVLYTIIISCILSLPKPSLAAGYIGIDFEAGDQLVVESIHSKSPASNAHIKPGDLILKINDQPVNTVSEFKLRLLEAEGGDRWSITLDRKGKIKTLKVNLYQSDLPPEDIAIQKIIWEGKDVVLVNVLLATNIITPRPESGIEEWKEAIKSRILAEQESKYAQLATIYPNFCVVDRAHLDNVIAELDFSKSGYISGEIRKKIGKLLGVTHILGVTYSRTPFKDGSWTELWTRKLIEVESGKILTVSIIEQEFTSKGKLKVCIKNWEKESKRSPKRIKYIPPGHREKVDEEKRSLKGRKRK